MNFKAYDILSSLVPGFITLLYILEVLGYTYNNNFVVAYTAIAFLTGYIMNTISSWLEDFYFLTWVGKPSSMLLKGKDIWKVRFSIHDSVKVKNALLSESGNPNATNDELFLIAMRYGNGQTSRVGDFNAMYAFSRVLLTTILIGAIFLLIENYTDLHYYLVLLPTLFVIWLRCKQRGYYYAREVLNDYIKAKNL